MIQESSMLPLEMNDLASFHNDEKSQTFESTDGFFRFKTYGPGL